MTKLVVYKLGQMECRALPKLVAVKLLTGKGEYDLSMLSGILLTSAQGRHRNLFILPYLNDERQPRQ